MNSNINQLYKFKKWYGYKSIKLSFCLINSLRDRFAVFHVNSVRSDQAVEKHSEKKASVPLLFYFIYLFFYF